MDKAEIQRIVTFLNDIHEGICEGDEATTLQQQLGDARDAPYFLSWGLSFSEAGAPP